MVILAAVMIVSMQLFGGVITSLFVDEPEIIAMGAVFVRHGSPLKSVEC